LRCVLKAPFSLLSEGSVGWGMGALSGRQLPCRHLKLGEMTLLQVSYQSGDGVERSAALSSQGAFFFSFLN